MRRIERRPGDERRPDPLSPLAGRGLFADFVCRERRVVVEVDGGTHSTDAEVACDARRTAELRREGYRLFRVCNDDVYHNLDSVLDGLLAFIEAPR